MGSSLLDDITLGGKHGINGLKGVLGVPGVGTVCVVEPLDPHSLDLEDDDCPLLDEAYETGGGVEGVALESSVGNAKNSNK